MAYRQDHRRPSPEPRGDDRRKRQRSFSPDPRDYEQRRGGGDSWSSNGSRPRAVAAYPLPIPRPPRVPAPESLPYLVPRRHFHDYLAEVYPSVYEDKPRLEEAWRRYKRDWFHRQFSDFLQEHQLEPWFRERYDPALDDLRVRLRLKGTEGRVDSWLHALAKGTLSTLCYDSGSKNLDQIRDDSNDSADTVKEEPTAADDQVKLPEPHLQLVIKSVSAEISREALEKHCSQAPGFDYVALTDPNSQKRFHRVAFVTFKPSSDMKRAEEILFESKINNFTLHMSRALHTNAQRVRQYPSAFSTSARLKHDLAAIKLLVEKLEAEIKDDRASAAITSQAEEWELQGILSSEEIVKKSLDLYLHLLRTCFHTCYYCAITCNFPEELQRKCVRHLRQPLNEKDTPRNDDDSMRVTDEKVEQLVKPGELDVLYKGGEDFEVELSHQCAEHVKVEEAGKYRCKSCNKLFKAPEFVEKHLLNKHAELLNVERLDRIRMLNNYVLDPQHLAPNFPTPPDPSRPPPANVVPLQMGPPISFGPPAYPAQMLQPLHFVGLNTQSPTSAVSLSERIGERTDRGSPPKRPKRDLPSGPPRPPPEGSRIDPRAQSQAKNYRDLDSSVPAGDGELEY